MALAYTPTPAATASAAELSLCPSWLDEVQPVVGAPEPVFEVASVHPIHPEPEALDHGGPSSPAGVSTQGIPAQGIPAPGMESHPAFQHPAFYEPGFTHPSFQTPTASDPQPVAEQWATVLPFVRSDVARAAQVPVVAFEEVPPIDYRPVWMGAAFFASTLCVYASSAPTWVSDPVALASDSFLQRLAATSFQLFGATALTTVTGVAAVAFLLAGTHRLG